MEELTPIETEASRTYTFPGRRFPGTTERHAPPEDGRRQAAYRTCRLAAHRDRRTAFHGLNPVVWQRVTKFDERSAALADRHYSRRKVGSPQFMPPGQTLILLTPEADAVFGWWRPDPASGIRQMNGLDGWTCTIFRNESRRLSSEMILAAEDALLDTEHGVGPDGFITYVWDKKVASTNPGYCFKRAGWKVTGRSADGKKTLLQKLPFEGIA